jgi:hypothetical protein
MGNMVSGTQSFATRTMLVSVSVNLQVMGFAIAVLAYAKA